jgi:hypothetical protein
MLSDPLKKKLRDKAKKAHRRELAAAIEVNGHHPREQRLSMSRVSVGRRART